MATVNESFSFEKILRLVQQVGDYSILKTSDTENVETDHKPKKQFKAYATITEESLIAAVGAGW